MSALQTRTNALAKPIAEALPEWDLRDLYPSMDGPEYRDDMAALVTESSAFATAFRGKLAALARHPPEFADMIRRFEAIEDKAGRLMSYAGLVYAGDTSNPNHAKFYGDTQEKLTAAGSDLIFFTLEINRLDDAVLAGLCADPALMHYAPWFADVRREKPYQLEDRVEQLFHEKSITGRGAWNRLFDETIADLRFKVRGQSLTLDPTLNLLQNPRPAMRKAAAAALTAGLAGHVRTFTLITNTLAKDREISDQWRGFKDVAASRHLSNRVEGEVVDAMVSAVEAAFPHLSHRYYRLKAKWFGVPQLDFWDRNAPLPHAATRATPWGEARDTVLDAYRHFSPRMADIAVRFFESDWIDAAMRPGKAPGAFAHPTVPSAHPYVLINYQGKTRDVMTLAHELGHGVHQVLAAPNGALMAPTPLTLAETASVFGEMLTFRSLLAKAQSPQQRKTLLAGKVEDMLNTVVRQVAFYLFERRVHEARRAGELTSEAIAKIWMDVQAASLGPAIRLGPGYEVFWTYIPHFIHSPFYVYAYAFGDCLVNSLYGVYENAHEGFAERYLAMLAAGGTRHHSELLAGFGLNAADPAFWKIGLNLISGMITELETMA